MSPGLLGLQPRLLGHEEAHSGSTSTGDEMRMEWDEEQAERTYIHTRDHNSPGCGDKKLGIGLREAGPEPHLSSSRLLKYLSSPMPYTISLSHCYNRLS